MDAYSLGLETLNEDTVEEGNDGADGLEGGGHFWVRWGEESGGGGG